MGIKVANNAFGTLSASITSIATTVILAAGEGARFPTLVAGDYFYATVIDTSNNLEIVKVTARSTDTMTIVRAQDSTTARAYSTNDRFELRPTAALFNELIGRAVSGANSDITSLTGLTTPLSVAQGGTNAITAAAARTSLGAAASGVNTDITSLASPLVVSGTSALTLPVGTTAQRPASPVVGMQRINTTTGYLEVYGGGSWYNISNVYTTQTVEYLVVAGGGGGSTTGGGGGGAGGYLTASGFAVAAGVALTVTVGAGGAAATSDGANGVVGSPSVFSSITAAGGGAGHHVTAGGVGGSGGGAGYGTFSGGSETGGQGNNGGSTSATGSPNFACGGGGGAGAVGGAASGTTGGNGGVGLSSSISGSSVFYAGGGGGSGLGGTSGGNGGGGAGGTTATGRASATANTGGGGGGGGAAADGKGLGGSGVVIIRYADTYSAAASTTGSPTITVAGGYRVYKWTSSGSITF